MTLAAPWFLLLALLVPVAFWLGRRTPAVLFAPGGDGLPRTWRVRLLPLPRLLQIAGLLLAVVALARPVLVEPLPERTEGIDIMLCLDTSSSMTANDLDARRSRLEVAKQAAARFILGRPDDRIGLVSFARFPDLRCPPTPDHRALQEVLAGVTKVTGDGPEDATGIGGAVAKASQVLGGAGGVVILLTDGEENIATTEKPEEIAPIHAGQLARQLGVRVYAISVGLGSLNRKREWVAIDPTQIRRLAKGTGGRFFEARDANAVTSVYAEIDALEKAKIEEPRFRTIERFLPFLTAALSLLLASLLLQSTLLRVLP